MVAKLPVSPADGLFLKDDFFSNDSVADAVIGELTWEIVTIGNASTYANLVTTDTGVGQYGVLRQTSANTANGDGSVLRLDEDNIVLGGGGGYFRVKFRIPTTLTEENFRIGLVDSVTVTEPTVGIWLESTAGALTVEADSATEGDNNVSIGTAVVDTWHEVLVKWYGTNASGGPETVEGWLDGVYGGKTPCLIDNDEEMEFSINSFQDSDGNTNAVLLDLDYIELFIAR